MNWSQSEYRNRLIKVLKAAEKKHLCDILIQKKVSSKNMKHVIKNGIDRNAKKSNLDFN